MKFETGDIIIFNSGTWGHVAMCFESGEGSEATFIHATHANNFAITPQMIEVSSESGSTRYYYFVMGGNHWHFRPNDILASDQERLKEVATAIARHAKYGVYRASRLQLGSSTFGSGAKDRLDKYIDRYARSTHSFNPFEGAIVKTLTCSEAVILCYQLTFERTSKFFIEKDAAHTMPRTLATYLGDNGGAWEMKESPND